MVYQFRCVDAGAACGAGFTAETQEELLRKVSQHLQGKHNVKHVTKTLQNYALKVAQQR